MIYKPVLLGDLITEIRNGIDLDQFEKPFEDGMLPITRIETISNGEINFERVRYVKILSEDRRKYQLYSGDILFSHINSPEHIGKTAIYRSETPLIHGINLLLLRPNIKYVFPEYMLLYLKSEDVRNWFTLRCKKAVNQASLNQADITSIQIPLPSLTEQQRIAAILQKADRIRRLRRYARSLSDTFLQSVFLQMFGDRSRFDIVRFGDVVKIDRKKANENECKTLPYVGLEHLEKDSGRFSLDFQHLPQEMLAINYRFSRDHVLYGKLRPYLNKVVIAGFDGVCTTEILPLLPVKGKMEKHFLWVYLQSNIFVKWASANVAGANLPRLSPDGSVSLTHEMFGKGQIKFNRKRPLNGKERISECLAEFQILE